nr:MAG TPA: intron associated endonuclease [Caudoviricetes sp.]
MNETKRYFVYAHENKFNGKVYVGITGKNKPEKRWQNGNGYKGTYFYNAIKKYGWDGFEHKILFSGLTQSQAFDVEKRLIKELQSNKREYGYNIADGGQYPGECAIKGLEKARENNKVSVIRLNDGKIYASIIEAQKDNNVPNENIVKVCRNIRHTAGFMPGTKTLFFGLIILMVLI